MAQFGYEELQRAALAFILEGETWPVFLAWAAEYAVSDEATAWLAAPPDLGELRRAWLAHSEDPDLAAIGRRAPA